MSAPTIRVEIGFGANASLGSFFVLDNIKADGTVGSSVLGSTTKTLGGTVFVDVTDHLSGQVTTTRGRSRETDQYQAGVMSFQLRNEDFKFDPRSGGSTKLSLRLIVNAYVAMETTEFQFFNGYVDDINVTYDMPDISVINVTCIDAFSVLSNAMLRNYTPTAAWTTGRAVGDVLDRVGYTSKRSIAAGISTIQSTTQTSISALDFCRLMARTENGYFFVDRTGVVTFANRYKGQGQYPSVLFTDDQTPTFTFYVGYTQLTQNSQATLLYNEVTGTRTGGTQQVATDSTSQATYFIRSLDIGQVENQTDAQVAEVCKYVIGKYANPETRLDNVAAELNGLSVDEFSRLMSLDILDHVEIQRFASSGSAGIDILSMVDGIACSFDASSLSFKVVFNFSSLDTQHYITLDYPFTTLDSDRLNY